MNPNQPRVPKGSPDGGQFAGNGASGASAPSKSVNVKANAMQRANVAARNFAAKVEAGIATKADRQKLLNITAKARRVTGTRYVPSSADPLGGRKSLNEIHGAKFQSKLEQAFQYSLKKK